MYHVMQETVTIDGVNYPTYAIVSPIGQVVVHDVTPNMHEAYRLAALFEEQKAEPCHLKDLVEDYLASQFLKVCLNQLVKTKRKGVLKTRFFSLETNHNSHDLYKRKEQYGKQNLLLRKGIIQRAKPRQAA